jgi:hypothetical protein
MYRDSPELGQALGLLLLSILNMQVMSRLNSRSRVGVIGRHKRAAEIGWDLQIITPPRAGMRIRVEKSPVREVQI